MTAPSEGRSHWPLVILSTIPSLLGILLPLILVRTLNPAEVGTFKIFFLYLGVAPALSLTLGLRSGLAYWSGKPSQRDQAFATSSNLILGLAVAATSATLILRHSISERCSATPLEASLFGLSLLGTIAGPYFEDAAIATGRIWRGALFYCVSEIVRTAFIVGSLLYYRSLTAVLVAHTSTTTLKLFLGYLYGYRLGIVRFIPSSKMVREVWRYALPVSLAYIFGIFIGSADQFLLAPRIGPGEFALYSIGCLSVAPLLIFEQSVTRVIIPQMAQAFSRNDRHRATALYHSAVDNLAFILVPAVTGLVVFAAPIIELLFTNTYAPAARYLKLYALSYALLVVPHDAVARARGEARWILRTFVIFASLSLGLAYILMFIGGPLGALVGILISGAALRGYTLIYNRASFATPISNFLPLRSILYYVAVSAVLGSLALSLRPLFSTPRGWLFGGGALFSISYFFIALPRKNRAERYRAGENGVLILSQSLRVGGLEKMILHLCEELKRAGRWRVRVFAYDHSEDSQTLVDRFHLSRIPVETFKKGRGFSLQAVYRILRTVVREDIHIIHSHDLGTLLYAITVKLCSFGRVSVVHTQHSFPHSEDILRYRVYRLFATAFADRLSIVSESLQSSYAPFLLTPTPIHMIQNGVTFADAPVIGRSEKVTVREGLLPTLPPTQRNELAGLVGDLWIIYLARFYPGKGQDRAIALWRELPSSERNRSVLCLIGPESAPGEYARIKALVSECPNPERVFIVAGSKDPIQWIQAGDLFLSCSEYEGMPLAPLEAAGSGMPLLLSDIPGHLFLKANSAQFPLDDLTEGASQMQTLLRQILQGGETYEKELWERGRGIRERFSIANMAAKYSKLYEISAPSLATGCDRP